MELYVSFSDVMHFFRRKWIKFLLVVVLFGVVCSLLPLQTAS
jgi:succinoglycan biosynthesis transport protein ExoP